MKRLIASIAVLAALALPNVAWAQTEPEEPPPLPPGVARSLTAEGFAPVRWQGATATGANTSPFINEEDPTADANIECGDSETTRCDVSLIELRNPLTQEQIDAGVTSQTKGATVRIWNDSPLPDPPTDIDLEVWSSNAEGQLIEQIGVSGSFDNNWAAESVSFPVKTTVEEPGKFYILRVIYFAVAEGSYIGQAGFDLPLGAELGGRVAKDAPFAWKHERAFGYNYNYWGDYGATDPSSVTIGGAQTVTVPAPAPVGPQTIDVPALPTGPVTTPDPYDVPPAGTCTGPTHVDPLGDGITGDAKSACGTVLVELSSPVSPEEVAAGKTLGRTVTVEITDGTAEAPDPGDADLFVYELLYDPITRKWSQGAELGGSGELDPDNSTETVSFSYKPALDENVRYIIVKTVLFANSPVQQMQGSVTISR